jgi:hypothetical protein
MSGVSGLSGPARPFLTRKNVRMLDRPRSHPPPPRAPPSNSRSARISRAYRARVARGERVAPAPYDAAVIDFLIGTRWLLEKDAGDRRLVGAAVYSP